MTAIANPVPQEEFQNPRRMESRERDAGKLMSKALVGLPDRAPYMRRWKVAQEIRQPMESVYREVRDYILPSLGRYLSGEDSDNHDYSVNHSFILDSSPTKMALTAADGLHGGLTNQAEQWFSLYVGNYKDYENTFSADAKAYITNAQECTRDTLSISNFYSAIYQFYLEVMGFGVALMLILSDPITRARYFTKTIGTYWLTQDSSMRIDAVFIRSTVRALDIVKDYGSGNCPQRVLEAVERNPDRQFAIIQCIQPWNFFGRNKPHLDFKYEDVRWVEGGDDNEKILFRGGYRTKPFVAMRWTDAGDAVYSRSCPGLDALPDVKQLQEMTLDFNKATKWLSDPAWLNASQAEIDEIIPGGIYKTVGDPRAAMLQPLIPPQFNLQANTEAAQALRDRISAIFYNREILLVQSRQRQITATEVDQLVVEKNTVLGPITARTGDNALIPILDRTYEIESVELNILQDPPEEIQGLEVKPYFSGQLARAQRQGQVMSQATQALQIAGTLAGLAQVSPSAADGLLAFDFSGMVRALDEVEVFPSGTVHTQDEIDELKAQQAQAMQQQQQAAGMQQMVDMAKTAGDTSVAPDTLLGQMAGGGEGTA